MRIFMNTFGKWSIKNPVKRGEAEGEGSRWGKKREVASWLSGGCPWFR